MGSLHSLVERWRVFSVGTNLRNEIDSFSFSLSPSLPLSLSLRNFELKRGENSLVEEDLWFHLLEGIDRIADDFLPALPLPLKTHMTCTLQKSLLCPSLSVRPRHAPSPLPHRHRPRRVPFAPCVDISQCIFGVFHFISS